MSDKKSLAGYLHLLVIYIVWGTTYLGIRVAVREGAGFPPFAMGAMRLLVAGSVLLLTCWLGRKPLKITRREFIVLGITGILLWNGGNGLVLLGETKADSGYTALLVSTTPIWAALIETIISRKAPHWLLVISLVMGFAGLAVLSAPSLMSGAGNISVPIAIVLVAAPAIWALGSVFQKRSHLATDPIVASAYQQLMGGVGFVILSLLSREPLPTPNLQAWLAWGYLVVFGSLLAFTSYTLALRMLPMGVLMTYAYVNPVVAVFLGWLILREPVGIYTIAGTVLVLLSVAGTFKAKHQPVVVRGRQDAQNL